MLCQEMQPLRCVLVVILAMILSVVLKSMAFISSEQAARLHLQNLQSNARAAAEEQRDVLNERILELSQKFKDLER